MEEIRSLIKLCLAQLLAQSGFDGTMKISLEILVDTTELLLLKLTRDLKRILLVDSLDGNVSLTARKYLSESFFNKESFEFKEYTGFIRSHVDLAKKIRSKNLLESLNILPPNEDISIGIYNDRELDIKNNTDSLRDSKGDIIKQKGIDIESIEFIERINSMHVPHPKENDKEVTDIYSDLVSPCERREGLVSDSEFDRLKMEHRRSVYYNCDSEIVNTIDIITSKKKWAVRK